MANSYTYAKTTDLDDQISKLIDTAPENLNTFKELADALGNDPNYATTIMTKLENKVDKEESKELSLNLFIKSDKDLLTLRDFKDGLGLITVDQNNWEDFISYAESHNGDFGTYFGSVIMGGRRENYKNILVYSGEYFYQFSNQPGVNGETHRYIQYFIEDNFIYKRIIELNKSSETGEFEFGSYVSFEKVEMIKKEEGKGLSTNDYTTEEKKKLSELNNYDDSEIKLRDERLKYYGDPDIIPFGWDDKEGCDGSRYIGSEYDEENKTAKIGIAQEHVQYVSPNVADFDNTFVIPYSLRKDGVDYLVTGIIDRGFSYECDCTINSMKSLIIPSSIKTVGEYAFGNCNLENSVDFSHCTSIGECAVLSSSSGFAIKGYAGSVADTYAKENGIEFVYIGGDVSKAYVDEKVGDIAIDPSFKTEIEDALAQKADISYVDEQISKYNGNTDETKTKSGNMVVLSDIGEIDLDVQLTSDSVTDFSSIPLYKTGKNLFDVASFEPSTYLTLSEHTEKGIVVTSSRTVATAIEWFIDLPSGTYTFKGRENGTLSWYRGTLKDDDTYSYSLSFQTKPDSLTKTFTLSVPSHFKISGTCATGTNTIENIQLELGESVTDYEVFRKQVYTPNSSGVVDGVESFSPTTILYTETADVIVNISYKVEKPAIEVVDNLESVDSMSALSANQGRILNEKINNALYNTEEGIKTYTYDDILWTDGVLKKDGIVYEQTFHYTSDFIEVIENSEIQYDGLKTISVYHPIIVFYDKDKNVIDSVMPTDALAQVGSVIVPVNTKYIKFVSYKNNTSTVFNGINIPYHDEILIIDEIIEELDSVKDVAYSIFKNKKGVFLGDSITAGMSPEYVSTHDACAQMNANGRNDKIYYEVAGEELGLASYVGYGISGTTIKAGMGTSGEPFVNRFEDMDDDADLVCVFGGTNDYGLAATLGTIDDDPDKSQSFYSALKYLIIGLVKKYPNARIIFCTPLPRFEFVKITDSSKLNSQRKEKYVKDEESGKWYFYDWTSSAWVEDEMYNQALADGTATEDYTDEYDFSYRLGKIKNNKGNSLSEFVKAIKEVCAMYSIPVCDFNAISRLYPYTRKSRYDNIGDGLHPHSHQHIIMGRLLANAINEKC